MAEGKRRMRRFRWLVIVGVVGAGVWAARSRQRSSGLLLEQWPAPDPTAPADGSATRQPLTAVPDPDSTAPVSGPSEDATPSAAPTAPDPVLPDPGDALPSNVSGEALFAPATPAAGMPATTARPSPRPRSAEPLRDYGPGSAEPRPDGSAPGPEYTIKAEVGSMLFHRPDSPYYSRTKAEVWFRTATDARAAGFVEWVPTDHRGS